MGDSDPRILEMPAKLQGLQPIAVPNTGERSLNPAKGSPAYVGITPHLSHRLGVDKDEKQKREQKEMAKNNSGIVKSEKIKYEKARSTCYKRADTTISGISECRQRHHLTCQFP